VERDLFEGSLLYLLQIAWHMDDAEKAQMAALLVKYRNSTFPVVHHCFIDVVLALRLLAPTKTSMGLRSGQRNNKFVGEGSARNPLGS
jgi:hypothetical protein